jgi:hypothetical protein
MAIIDSLRKLAEKVGADTNGRDIADQLNIINKHLDNTQPGSRDIAEAVSKFADKEDGTAILTTKTITENKTYKASDDGASGYSSVTVNVPFTFNKIEAYGDTNGCVIIINVDSDEVTVNAMTDSGASFSRSIKKLIISGSAPKHIWIFAPTNDFDGIYKGENKLTFTGDTVVPGEGVYKATIDEIGGTRTIQTLFSGTRVPFEIL